MPALSADPAERETLVPVARATSTTAAASRGCSKGSSYLHHPLRAEASAKYVQPSLEMLWEIQKTGDIFFPKRWLDATLGGHRSREVADTVRGISRERCRPNYPERLRNIMLQSADELYRAAEIVKTVVTKSIA